jgi:hypothetical protein
MPGVVMVSGGISGNVSPAYKKGEKYNAANYRPISLTFISCKIMEHVITKHVLSSQLVCSQSEEIFEK